MSIQDTTALATPENGANLRVIFYNIYGYDNDFPITDQDPDAYNGSRGGPITLRHDLQMDIFSHYSPDILGFQEYVNTSHNGLTPRLRELGYCEVPYQLPEGDEVNDTPIFYKDSSVKLIEGGYRLYRKWMEGVEVSCNNSYTKSLSWAVFEQKCNGHRFIFVSTHLMYTADWQNYGAYEQARCANVSELFTELDEVRKKYPELPVILGGDLNTTPDCDSFKKLQERFTWMQYAPNVNADPYGFKGYSTYSFEKEEYAVCPLPPETGHGIDHVLYSGDVKVTNYLTLTDRASLLASDHCPKLADIVLN